MNSPLGSRSLSYSGRQAPRAAALPRKLELSANLKLFASTYVAGFLVVSLFIA